MIDFKKALKGKFIIIGHKVFNQSMFHHGLDSLELAKEYVNKIVNGDVEIKNLSIANSVNDLDGIDVINDAGETVYSWRGCYGSFLLGLE